MFRKIKKIFKMNMLNRNQLQQHSIVFADRRITRVPDNTELALDIPNHQIPFSELTSIILITNSLRACNINDTVLQMPSSDSFTKVFETPNFSLRLEPLRFVCVQKTHFDNFQCGGIMQNLVNSDITGNTRLLIGSIGVNYECRLSMPNTTIFQRLFQQNAILCNNQALQVGNFKFTYNINDNLLINIQIFMKQNQWVVSFNADNLVNINNTIETILSTDFYNTYFVPMYNELFVSNY